MKNKKSIKGKEDKFYILDSAIIQRNKVIDCNNNITVVVKIDSRISIGELKKIMKELET
jgi:hypothetical protein